MKTVFTGDLFLGGDLVNYTNDSIHPIDAINEADQIVCNLEQGSGDNDIELNKSTLSAPLKSLRFLVNNKINIISLANNHIQDKGEIGFKQTLNYVHKYGIKTVGAGKNLKEAARAVDIGNNYFLFSFCTFGKKYLKKVKIATSSDYGVNPLTYQNILKGLHDLPSDAKAILIFHWGRENVWLPPHADVTFAKKVLDLEKVHCIIGMHPHRIQGKIKHNEKYVYFSLGNFLFPNFFITPRTKIFYPDKNPATFHTTKEYHPVFSPTYKMWKSSNRRSMLLTLDSNTGRIVQSIVKQDMMSPELSTMNYKNERIVTLWFNILSWILTLPKFIYIPFEYIWRVVLSTNRYYNIFVFYLLKEKKILSFLRR
jgi:hypothetical protein